jgi:hypothetical protein
VREHVHVRHIVVDRQPAANHLPGNGLRGEGLGSRVYGLGSRV